MNVERASRNSPVKISVVKTIASERKGIEELKQKILEKLASVTSEKKYLLLAEKAYQLIQNKRMKDVSKSLLKEEITNNYSYHFNLYQFIESFIKRRSD